MCGWVGSYPLVRCEFQCQLSKHLRDSFLLPGQVVLVYQVIKIINISHFIHFVKRLWFIMTVGSSSVKHTGSDRCLRIVLVAKGIPSPRRFGRGKKSMATWFMVMSPSPGVQFQEEEDPKSRNSMPMQVLGFGTLRCNHNVEDDGNAIIFLKYGPLLWLYLQGRALYKKFQLP